ncbi:acylphosphatase-2-like [Rhinophrynus dorsalis]
MHSASMADCVTDSNYSSDLAETYTEDQARRVNAVGWVKNAPQGTVMGQVQGSKEIVEIMKNWLKNVGSPMSRIDKAIFSNERQIPALEYSNFKTKY